MTHWDVYHGDIFMVKAEALICSANVFLTLSGGVGGELLRRYGVEMQSRLNTYLARRDLRHVPKGTVVSVETDGTPYRVILHAVAVDGMYESSVSTVANVTNLALCRATEHGAKSAVLPALATGYGRLSMRDFIEGFVQATRQPFHLDRVTVVLRDERDTELLRQALTCRQS